MRNNQTHLHDYYFFSVILGKSNRKFLLQIWRSKKGDAAPPPLPRSPPPAPSPWLSDLCATFTLITLGSNLKDSKKKNENIGVTLVFPIFPFLTVKIGIFWTQIRIPSEKLYTWPKCDQKM